MVEYVGLWAIMLQWVAIGYLLTRWRGTNEMSISMHAASQRSALWLFVCSVGLSSSALIYWMLVWLMPTYRLGIGFSLITIITVMLLAVAVAVPDREGVRRRIHRLAAYSMAASLIGIVASLTISENISMTARLIGLAAVLYMLMVWTLFLFVPRARPHYLIFQTSYIAFFHFGILAAAYLHCPGV